MRLTHDEKIVPSPAGREGENGGKTASPIEIREK